MKFLIFFLALFFVLFPIYGYFFRETHTNLSITFTSSNNEINSAQVIFLDNNNLKLAEGILINNFIHILHPELGNCRSGKNSRNFRPCFNKLTWYISDWIEDVKNIQIIHENCKTKPLGIELYREKNYGSEIFTWWIPLPHIGGKPYTSYSSTFHLLNSQCI